MDSVSNIHWDWLKDRLNGLVVCLSHSWGGLEQVAANDALDVGSLGFKIRVLCLDETPIYEYLKNRKEVEVIPLTYRPRNFFDLKLRAELADLISQGTNLIHTHQTSLLGSIVPGIWRQPGVALLATRHIMNNHNKRNFFHRAIYARVDALLVISEAVRENVLQTHWLREPHVKVVNLGLDFERFDPAKVDPDQYRAQWGADNDTVVIGLVGRVDPAKGQETFIKAAAGLLKNLRAGEQVKFVMVGDETPPKPDAPPESFLEELKKIVTQFRIEEHVVFAGFSDQIPEVMRAFDICVMPSRQEAFGLVAIEAMAMECPVIISRGGSAQEIVGENEDFGLTVRPDDAFHLQQQLRYLLDNPMERVRMGQRARQHVIANYDRKSRFLKTLKHYEKALRRRQRIRL